MTVRWMNIRSWGSLAFRPFLVLSLFLFLSEVEATALFAQTPDLEGLDALIAEEVVRRTRYLPQAGPFRASYGNSNLMFVASGEVIAAVSGMSWADFAESRIARLPQLVTIHPFQGVWVGLEPELLSRSSDREPWRGIRRNVLPGGAGP